MAELTLETCRTILRAALAKGAEMGWKPMSAAVVDGGGHMLAFERADGASPGRFEIARAKAHGAAMLHMGGVAQAALAEAKPQVAAALTKVYGGQFFPVPGGVLLRDADGNVLGAVGVTGDTPDNDAQCAVAGAEAGGVLAEA
ncbi:GlcG/HbpS family heme-binding protein [Tropicimonas marinistellae]|uniref:GlcG/HbpS family heme-binding protein n=1 Tax=Tropicimonas marinistellae TaxID=1739787 RepID=UPI000830DE9F|nr:heme-binding protein [Tropicimonas marinistellae]